MNLLGAKIYNDGSNWIAIPHTERPYKPRDKPKALTENENKQVEKFEEAFNQTVKGKRKTRKENLLKELAPLFPTQAEAEEFVEKHYDRMSRNRWERIKRMKRKAYLQPWSYFCTFTYSDEKQTEESFRKRLMTCLNHLQNRNGWRYMGAWERGDIAERLHFHALVYVPPNGMVGELEEHNDYSVKLHSRRKTVENTFFNERFGKSDFNAITHQQEVTDSLAYMLKYITKNNERVIYSRGLKSYIVSDVWDEDVLCPYGDEEDGFKFILAQDFTCIVDGEIMGKVSPEVIAKMPKSN